MSYFQRSSTAPPRRICDGLLVVFDGSNESRTADDLDWILKDAEGQATDCSCVDAPAPGRFVPFRVTGVVVYLSLL